MGAPTPPIESGAPTRRRSSRGESGAPGRGRRAAAALAVAAALAIPGATTSLSEEAPSMGIHLVDVAEEAGVSVLNLCGGPVKDWIVDSNGNGAAIFDYDGDGDLDLLITNGSTLERFRETGGDPLTALYRNEGDLRFRDVTSEAGLDDRGWGSGVCVADLDADGDPEVYVTAWGPNHLYLNRGDGTFEDVGEERGIADPRWGTGCAFGDPDRDGDLDLYASNYVRFDEKEVPRRGVSHTCEAFDHPIFCGPSGLDAEPDVFYRNRGDGTFDEALEAAGMAGPSYYGFGAVFSDLSGDGWPDLYVSNDSRPNFYFENRGDGTFEDNALLAGAALGSNAAPQASMGTDIADYDEDGDYDVFVTNFSQDHNTLYRNEGGGLFTDSSFLSGLAGPSLRYLGWSAGFVDLDHDGDLDLFVANGHIFHDVADFGAGSTFAEPNQVFENVGGGRFRDASAELGPDLVALESSRGAPWGDLDGDGDLDFLVVELNDQPTLLRNDGGSRRPFALVELTGRGGNRDALNARVTLEAGGRSQVREAKSGAGYASHSDRRLHFGLGDASRIDRLEVRWPKGARRRLLGLPVERVYRIYE